MGPHSTADPTLWQEVLRFTLGLSLHCQPLFCPEFAGSQGSETQDNFPKGKGMSWDSVWRRLGTILSKVSSLAANS